MQTNSVLASFVASGLAGSAAALQSYEAPEECSPPAVAYTTPEYTTPEYTTPVYTTPAYTTLVTSTTVMSFEQYNTPAAPYENPVEYTSSSSTVVIEMTEASGCTTAGNYHEHTEYPEEPEHTEYPEHPKPTEHTEYTESVESVESAESTEYTAQTEYPKQTESTDMATPTSYMTSIDVTSSLNGAATPAHTPVQSNANGIVTQGVLLATVVAGLFFFM